MKLKYYLRGLGLGVIFTTVVLAISFGIHGKDISDEEIVSRAEKLGMEMKESNPLFPENLLESETDEPGSEKQNAETLTKNGQKSDSKDSDNNTPDKTDQSPNKTDSNQAGTGSNKTDSNQAETGSDKTSSNKAGTGSEKTGSNKTGTGLDKADSNKSGTGSDKAGSNKTGTGSDKTDSNKTGTDKTDSKKTEQDADGSKPNVTLTVKDGDGCRQIAEKLQKLGVIDDTEKFRDYMSRQGLDGMIQTGTFSISKNATQKEIAKILTAR